MMGEVATLQWVIGGIGLTCVTAFLALAGWTSARLNNIATRCEQIATRCEQNDEKMMARLQESDERLRARLHEVTNFIQMNAVMRADFDAFRRETREELSKAHDALLVAINKLIDKMAVK